MGKDIIDELDREHGELAKKLLNLMQSTQDEYGSYTSIEELIQIQTRLKWISKQRIELDKGSSAHVQEINQKIYEQDAENLERLINIKENAEEIRIKEKAQEFTDETVKLGCWFSIAIFSIVALIANTCS